ncbi:hypothetical protein [Allomuricauda sp. d1]|uniref:hypothetical protein n=1 Tax=Allomuricauda sp. d1 TaxID=3136725 RepID=UPI0031E0421A
MKAILTLTFVIFFGTVALAQEPTPNQKVATVEMGVVLTENQVQESSKLEGGKEVARLYKHKNARAKKELVFTTKRNKAKLA